MRLGILGGTLDPVHDGHLSIALAVRDALSLDGVILLPAGNPPHKHYHTTPADRWAMARLAAESVGIEASDAEILRGGTTYTVDTMRAFRAARPDVSWVYIVGGDTLGVMEKWRTFSEVAGMTEFAVVRRPGCDDRGDAELAQRLREEYGAVIHLLKLAGPDISSTQLREMAARGEALDGLTPERVARYIDENGLYLTAMPVEEVCRKLESMLTPHRWAHTLGVAQTAKRLAVLHGLPPARAYVAGLLHDAAKSMPPDEMLSEIRGAGIATDDAERATLPVLHAPASAALAYRLFGVRDARILSAIRWHTLGGRDMTPFDALIYVSDFVEPGREDFPGMAEARRLAETDLRAAARCCARLSLEYVAMRGERAHPRTLEMLEEN